MMALLDESDLLFYKDFGYQAPLMHYLMQAREYPVLFLFCGIFELRRQTKEYYSILFNTARVFIIILMFRKLITLCQTSIYHITQYA